MTTTDKPLTPLVYFDFETTGLGPATQAFELAWLPDDLDPHYTRSLILKHDLRGAEPIALEINGYWNRGISQRTPCDERDLDMFRRETAGATMVAANPRFDAERSMKLLGYEPWHYRMIDIESYAMPIFGWPRPKGLKDIREALVQRGLDIPAPDHTGKADVICLRTCFRALTVMSEELRARSAAAEVNN